MLQLRPKGTNDPFYAPHRDIAYLAPHLCLAAMRGLDKGAWEPWYKEYLDHHGVTEEELGKGAEVLADYLNACSRTPEDNVAQQVFERVGFLDLPKPVQFVIMAKVGQMALAGFFVGIREVTHLGEEPPMDIRELATTAADTAYYLSMPRWYRWIVRSWHDTKLWLVSKLIHMNSKSSGLPSGPSQMPVIPAVSGAGTDPVQAGEQALPDKLPRPGI